MLLSLINIVKLKLKKKLQRFNKIYSNRNRHKISRAADSLSTAESVSRINIIELSLLLDISKSACNHFLYV